MFKGLKNKIREETGSDVLKISPLIGGNSQKAATFKGKHSRQGSASSINSVSIDGGHVENSSISVPNETTTSDPSQEYTKNLPLKDVKLIEKREEEWKKKLNKMEMEWKRKLEDQEKEWKKELHLMEGEKILKEKSVEELQKALVIAEEFKEKYCRFQEEKEQLDGFQTQEMAKIKHLLLAKERELSEKMNSLKDSNIQITTLKSEVARLRRFEEEISNIQDAVSHEKNEVSEKLKDAEVSNEDVMKRLQDELSMKQTKFDQVQFELEAEKQELKSKISELNSLLSSNSVTMQTQLDQLQQQLEAEHKKLAELTVILEKERTERKETESKSAEVSRQVDLSNEKLQVKEKETIDLKTRIEMLESTLLLKNEEMMELQLQSKLTNARVLELEEEKELHIAVSNQEQNLQETVSDLESQLMEKDKKIKQLQQRLGDMKKTLQRELNLHPGLGGDSGSNGTASSGSASEDTAAAVLCPSSSHQVSQRKLQQQAGVTSNPDGCNDVNFQYLKHVLIKFLTSREYEAKHLTRAVATLLHFSPEEERLLRETVEWKMSWFGSRPNLGFGQTAKAIPPS